MMIQLLLEKPASQIYFMGCWIDSLTTQGTTSSIHTHKFLKFHTKLIRASFPIIPTEIVFQISSFQIFGT